MNIAPPPLWQELLLEAPLPLVISLVAAAVVLHLTGRRQGRPALTWGALAAGGLAAGVYLLATFYQTQREVVIDRTRQLVAATAPLDTAALDELIARGAVVTGPDGQAWLDYEQIRPELERAVQRHAVADHAIRGLAAEVTSEVRARSLLSLSTTVSSDYGLPIRTQWHLIWRKESDGQWRVIEIGWLEFQGRPPMNLMWR